MAHGAPTHHLNRRAVDSAAYLWGTASAPEHGFLRVDCRSGIRIGNAACVRVECKAQPGFLRKQPGDHVRLAELKHLVRRQSGLDQPVTSLDVHLAR